MNFLLIGGGGYIGSQLAISLRREHCVTIATRNLRKDEMISNVRYKKFDFIQDDYDDLLNGIDVVIHLVSTISPNDDMDNIKRDINDNLIPTIKLLDNMSNSNCKKIIFISSGGTVYGEGDNKNKRITEDWCLEPICHYGILKVMIEKYLSLYQRYKDIDYRVIRLSNPYSEKIKNGKKQGIIPIMIESIYNNETIKIWGDGGQVRDYIYMDDAIDAIVAIAKYNGEERIFNVGTGVGYTVKQIMQIIKKYLPNRTIKIEYCEKRKCDVDNNVLDISKIYDETGWTPRVDLDTGIKRIIEMINKKRIEL